MHLHCDIPVSHAMLMHGRMQAVILTGASNAVKSCEDGDMTQNPTCGWARDGNNKLIYNSQGFCCACTLSQITKTTVGSGQLQCTHSQKGALKNA